MTILLRPVRAGDVEIFYEQQADPEACRVTAFPARDRREFFAHHAKILQDPSVVIRAIESGGRVAGNVASFTRDGLREVCYWLGREFWGRGLATEALMEFLAESAQRPLYARVAKSNLASARVARKCGFVVVSERTGDDGVEECLLELR